MMCQLCGQRPAAVCLNIDLNGQRIQQYICDECAEERKLKENPSPAAVLALVNEIKKRQEEEKVAEPDKFCSSCGTAFSQFKKSGFLGCPECYKCFAEELIPFLDKITKPLAAPEEEKSAPLCDTRLLKLQLLQKRAIESENYEEAAKLRDEIAALRNPSGVTDNE